jgi:mono/diheme cytochrome c family protein
MRFLAIVGALAIFALTAGGVYFLGGFYSVAATEPSPKVVDWALENVRVASIMHHATDKPPVSMNDGSVVQAGARAFSELGCANCHGAPGVKWAKFSEAMRPDPPNLKEIVGQMTPEELFWVVKNGINMTGMPGFALIKADDQKIWTIVAFIKSLPIISAEDYAAWSAPAPGTDAPAKAP